MDDIVAKKKKQLNLLAPNKASDSCVFQGNSLNVLKNIPSEYCRAAITSPPYWGLRDYEISEQIGSEKTVEQYIEHLVNIFQEVRRILTEDGTLWLNIGDSYTSGGRKKRAPDKKNQAREMSYRAPTPHGLKPKDLVGVPWRLAFALQREGWFLRSEIIWHKPNAHPESVKDRPTRAHETLFLLSKNEQYYYDYESIKEIGINGSLRNKRTVWSVNTEPFNEAHFATFPPKLIEPCVLSGSSENDFILDPFFGSGTTGLVAASKGRNFLGIELNSAYISIAEKRLSENDISFKTLKEYNGDL
ncbi:MAG: site-specific DNA-methyltransferase [Candidatus Marinimicrobia bacterium]|nr:site-specific DNA-methyltransferase [Candidatus Neomarinimicrobiota bacterium]